MSLATQVEQRTKSRIKEFWANVHDLVAAQTGTDLQYPFPAPPEAPTDAEVEAIYRYGICESCGAPHPEAQVHCSCGRWHLVCETGCGA